MIRRYCDMCGCEVGDKNRPRGSSLSSDGRLGTTFKRKGAELKVEIVCALDGATNAGDVCKYCIIDAVMSMDDRPRAATEGGGR